MNNCNKCGGVADGVNNCINNCNYKYCKKCLLIDSCYYCGKQQCYYCGGSIIITCCCYETVCLQCIINKVNNKFLYCKKHHSVMSNECKNKECINVCVNLHSLIIKDKEFSNQVIPSIDKKLMELIK